MLYKTVSFLFGEVRLHFDLKPSEGADLFLKSGIPCYDQTALESAYECSIERRDLSSLRAYCRAVGVSFTIIKERGLRLFFSKALRRPGLLFGVLLGLFMLFEAPHYVWDIRVYGNESLSQAEVEEILASEGFSIGVRHASLDLHFLCNRIPQISESIAWISVNMMGGVAEIEVVENRPKPVTEEKNDLPVNLVASSPGQIVRFELTSGRPVVGVGQTVEVGQLLVAGYSEKESGLLPRISSGKVYAKTIIEESVFIPFAQSEKCTSDPILLEKSINISKKKIIFYKNGLQSGQKYDIVRDEYRPVVLSVALPFKVEALYALPYTYEERTIDSESARDKAKEELLSRIREKTDEILAVSWRFEEKEDGVLATLTATCITDIAVKVEVIQTE